MNQTRTDYDRLAADAAAVFGFDAGSADRLPGHEGGRNVVYAVGTDSVLRISNLTDRTIEDYLAETEYVHYLASHGAAVADVLPSLSGKTVEILKDGGCAYAVSMFERAKGDQLADHGYQYKDDAPIEELWYNTGKTLGAIHALSRLYHPTVKRFDFFDKYNESYFDALIPDDLTCPLLGEAPIGRQIKLQMHVLLEQLRALPTDVSRCGMIHFDFSDGNYNIDYTDGTVTAFDFDNCRTGRYMFDLANLWAHGVGWAAWNDDPEERKQFMERYFRQICAGYRSQAALTEDMLEELPLLLDTVYMENIIDEFEVQLSETGTLSCDGEQAYRIKCLLENIPYLGFFSDIYNSSVPFDLDS